MRVLFISIYYFHRVYGHSHTHKHIYLLKLYNFSLFNYNLSYFILCALTLANSVMNINL